MGYSWQKDFKSNPKDNRDVKGLMGRSNGELVPLCWLKGTRNSEDRTFLRVP